MSIYPSVHPSVYLLTYLPTCLDNYVMYNNIYLSICLSIRLSTYLSIWLSIYPFSVGFLLILSTYLPTYIPTIYLPIYPSICLPIYVSIYRGRYEKYNLHQQIARHSCIVHVLHTKTTSVHCTPMYRIHRTYVVLARNEKCTTQRDGNIIKPRSKRPDKLFNSAGGMHRTPRRC